MIYHATCVSIVTSTFFFFGRKPVSGDVNILTDVENIKRAVRNLILTNVFERPFHPELGSGVRDMLFENMTPFVNNVNEKS